jgi:hypothetical protein
MPVQANGPEEIHDVMTVLLHTRDQLLADVELASARLRSFDDGLEEVSIKLRYPFQQRHAQIAERCSELKRQIIEWPEVKFGTATAIEELSQALDALDSDFDASKNADPISYRAAVDRQLRAWRSRSDWMKVQSTLASMEIGEDLDEVGQRLTKARAGVLVELHGANEDAKELVVGLRDDIEGVLVDIRHAVERAADALIHSGKR